MFKNLALSARLRLPNPSAIFAGTVRSAKFLRRLLEFFNSWLLEFFPDNSGSRGLKAPGARNAFRPFQRLLLGQPFFPILRELIHVVFGDWNQFSLNESGRRIFVFRDLVVEHVN